jgi:hypothetical protein
MDAARNSNVARRLPDAMPSTHAGTNDINVLVATVRSRIRPHGMSMRIAFAQRTISGSNALI